MLVLCILESTYEKFCQSYVSQSSVNLNKQICLCICTWKKKLASLNLFYIYKHKVNACKLFAYMILFFSSYLCNMPHCSYHLHNISVTQKQDPWQGVLRSGTLWPHAQLVFPLI